MARQTLTAAPLPTPALTDGRRRFLLGALGAGLAATVGIGDVRADARLPVGFKSVVSGNAQPSIILKPTADLKQVRVTLKRSDGKTLTLSAAGMKAGTQRTLKVRQPIGKFSYQARFEAKWADGTSSSFALKFDLTRVDKLKLQVAAADADLESRKITFQVNNPLERAELKIVTASTSNEKPLRIVTKHYNKESGRLTIEWPKLKEEISFLELRVYDIAGFWTGIRLTPFSVSIPHDDVEFESAKWSIRASEEPKLKKTLGLIRDALQKHGSLIQLKLFVAGYTDTVGSKAANRTLSRRRAHAIAGWFRKHGLKVPISYQGFGEEVLAKPTPDETDEQANRRALYILASQTPAISDTLPKSNWQKL